MKALGDRGSATAEFAVALPAVAIVLVLGAGALAAGGTAVRLQDAVADAARLAARGESHSRATEAVTSAVDGARATVKGRGDLVCVEASTRSHLITVTATSCALDGGI